MYLGMGQTFPAVALCSTCLKARPPIDANLTRLDYQHHTLGVQLDALPSRYSQMHHGYIGSFYGCT